MRLLYRVAALKAVRQWALGTGSLVLRALQAPGTDNREHATARAAPQAARQGPAFADTQPGWHPM